MKTDIQNHLILTLGRRATVLACALVASLLQQAAHAQLNWQSGELGTVLAIGPVGPAGPMSFWADPITGDNDVLQCPGGGFNSYNGSPIAIGMVTQPWQGDLFPTVVGAVAPGTGLDAYAIAASTQSFIQGPLTLAGDTLGLSFSAAGWLNLNANSQVAESGIVTLSDPQANEYAFVGVVLAINGAGGYVVASGWANNTAVPSIGNAQQFIALNGNTFFESAGASVTLGSFGNPGDTIILDEAVTAIADPDEGDEINPPTMGITLDDSNGNPVPVVPEPATISLLALGALALLRRRQGKV